MRPTRRSVVLAVALAAFGSVLASGTGNAGIGEVTKLLPAGASTESIGWNVDTDGDTIVIGDPNYNSYRGAAYVYERVGGAWTFVQRLTGSTQQFANFGQAVSVRGNRILVGAPGEHRDGELYMGGAYLFRYNGSTWSSEAVFAPAYNSAGYSKFGTDVAVGDNDMLFVGAPGECEGRVYWYQRRVFSGWTLLKRKGPISESCSGGRQYGRALATDVNVLAIGRQNGFNVITFDPNDPTQGFEGTVIVSGASDRSPVAVSGNTIIVGAWGNSNAGSAAGAAFVYVAPNDPYGEQWILQQELHPDHPSPGDWFGGSVGISGDVAIVGADYDDDKAGSIHVFRRSGTTWTQELKISPPRGQSNSRFGFESAIAGDTIVSFAREHSPTAVVPYAFMRDVTPPVPVIGAAPARYSSAAAEISFTATDNLTEADALTMKCSLDGAAFTACSSPAALAGLAAGEHTFIVRAADVAGNAADTSHTWVADPQAPSITGFRSPAPNSYGWNNTSVTTWFECSDGISGIASCPRVVNYSAQTSGTSRTGTATDNVGNTASATIGGIRIDVTAPTLSGEPSSDPNAAGWYRGDVRILWSCSDALSGLQSCSAPTAVGEGRDLSATGIAFDRAGNSASAAVTGLNVDRTAPAIRLAAINPEPNEHGWNNTPVEVRWTCEDTLSGATAAEATAALDAEGAGQTAGGTCSDVADNAASHAVEVSIDTTAPVAAVDPPASAVTRALTGTAADTLAGVDRVTIALVNLVSGEKQTIDAACDACDDPTAIRWTADLSEVLPGLYEARAGTIDRAGNAGEQTPPITVVVA